MAQLSSSKNFQWNRVHATGAGTETNYRQGSTATLIGHSLWLIGGSRYSSRVSMLDTKARRWASVPYDGTPGYKLNLHTANLVTDRVLLFGVKEFDRHSQEEIASDELYIFDPLLLEMKSVPTYGGKHRPGYRFAHTADVYSKGNILVLMGGDMQGGYTSSQLHILDLASWRWSKPATRGEPPPPKKNHGSSLIDSRLFVYGGDMADSKLYSIDLWTMVWEQVDLAGAVGGRLAPTLIHVGMGRLMIYGGRCYSGRSGDVCIVESANGTAKRCHKLSRDAVEGTYGLSGEMPLGRALARMICTRDMILMVAGDVNDFSDYHELVPL